MPERGLWCLTHDFVLAMGLLTGEKKFMRTAFIGMLLGIGLMFLAASSGGPQCYPVIELSGTIRPDDVQHGTFNSQHNRLGSTDHPCLDHPLRCSSMVHRQRSTL